MTMNDVDKLWNQYNKYKETAEQFEFLNLIIIDSRLEPLYEKLKNNWSEHDAEAFAKVMREQVFPMLGIVERGD